MFTGIGGFELGIQRAALSVRNGKTEDTVSGTSEQSMESTAESLLSDGGITDHISTGDSGEVLCVGYSEIDKHAIQTFEHRFGKEIKNYGDATTINTADLPDFDLLVGGFPCQAFSVAGKRMGFEDTRGTLFFDVARVLRDKRPKYFILENVKGLLSHAGGETFQTILEVLTDTGYDVSWSIHNSKNYGVPQNRERIYIIGNLRGERRPQVFPLRQTGGGSLVQLNGPVHQDYRYYDPTGVAPTLNANRGGGAATHPFVKVREATKAGFAIAEEGDSINFSQPNSETRRGRVGKKVANTLETTLTQGTLEGSHIRRLTPVECERLQGFPDNWTLGSDSQRYKQCGNAITVNVVQHVIKELSAVGGR